MRVLGDFKRIEQFVNLEVYSSGIYGKLGILGDFGIMGLKNCEIFKV